MRIERDKLEQTASMASTAMEDAFAFLKQVHPGIVERNPDLLEKFDSIRESLNGFSYLPIDERLTVSQDAADFLKQIRFILSSSIETGTQTVH